MHIQYIKQPEVMLDYGMRGHIVEMYTNITLVVIYKLHGD